MARIIGLTLLGLLLFACFYPFYCMLFIFPAAFFFKSDLINSIAYWATFPAAALTSGWIIWLLWKSKKSKPDLTKS